MYGALDQSGNRVGNPIKASRIGDYAGFNAIEKKYAENRDYLKDLDRRKALAGRIRRVLAECRTAGSLTQPEVECRLLDKGISAVFRRNEDGRLVGVTFIDHRGKNVYNGSNLGKDLAANSWYELFSQRQGELIPGEEPCRPQTSTPVEGPTSEIPEMPEGVEVLTADDDPPDDIPFVQRAPGERRTTGDNNYIGQDNDEGHTLFSLLGRQSGNYEEIDPEFRLLYKRKKKKGKRRKR